MIFRLKPSSILILVPMLVLLSCGGDVKVSAVEDAAVGGVVVPVNLDSVLPNVTVNQAVSETIGSCTFVAIAEPTNRLNFSYRVTFSEPINTSTFTTADITNAGSGGAYTLTWSITNCGDDTNFKLIATAIIGNGTIIPEIIAGKVEDLVGNSNLVYTTTDNSVAFARTWTQEAYIKAVNGETLDNFGETLSLNGDTLVVGTTNEDSNQNTITNGATASANNANDSSGTVYVYKRTGTTWAQEAYIKAVNSEANDNFGFSISLHRDTLAVGARYEDSNQTTITNGATASADNSNSSAGAVYVYKRTGANWAQEAYIKAVNNDASDFFAVVSIYEDTLAVGANSEDSIQNTITNGPTASANNGWIASGAVYVYKRTGVTWTQEAYIKAAVTQTLYTFGSYLSLDKDTLVVSTPGESSDQNTITNGTTASSDISLMQSGAVYVYKRTGVNWAQEAFIKPPYPVIFANFARALSLHHDTLAVGFYPDTSRQNTITNGATASPDTSFVQAGAVFVYKRTGVNWAQEAYIKASNNNAGDAFGYSVSLKGNTLAVGAFREQSNQITTTIGPTASSNNGLSYSGAVYVYKRTGTTWAQEAYIKAINSDVNDEFGSIVSLSGDTLAVSAPQEDSNQITITNGATASADNASSNSGAVYIYRSNGSLFEIDTIWATSDSSSITLNWNKTGGLATGYLVAYQSGATAPATCALGTVVNVGDVNTHQELALSASTSYSFRVCATDGTDVTTGTTYTFSTTP